MAVPTSRAEFKEYCLRALGHPVLQINVDDEQVEDRIDEALYMYQQFHMDAVHQEFVAHRITGSTMVFDPAFTGEWMNGEQIRGKTSNALGQIHKATNANTIVFFMEEGTPAQFQVGETVVGERSGASGTIASLTVGDMDNKYVTLTPDIISVTRIFPVHDGRIYSDILFDPYAQFNMSLMSNFMTNSVIPYVLGRQYQQLLNDVFRGRPGIRFERHMGRVYVDLDWRRLVRPDNYWFIECHRIIDPNEFTAVWSDRWLQRYTIALIKRQWGMNLSKYSGIQLPGGVQLDGRSMLTEANQEVKDLEQELNDKYQLPPSFIVG